MIEWINVIILIISSLLMLHFYLKSVNIAALEEKIGKAAYQKCGRYRMVASIFEMIVIINYILFFFFPIRTIGIPEIFPWEWGLSIIIAIVIAIPSGAIMIKGLLDAGKAAMVPQADQELYKGIYTRIRHPQAVGELPLWWSLSLILNSPFLAFYSFVFIPIFYVMVRAEEKDLLMRFGKSYKEYMKKTGMFFPKRK